MISRKFLLLTALLCAASPLRALADVTLVVSRNMHSTTVYFVGPAEDLLGRIATSGHDMRPALTAPLTFTQGHEIAHTAIEGLADQTTFLSGTTPYTPSALPTLLHAGTDPLPFDTPFQASIATAVCTTPTAPLKELGSLRLYGGLTADLGLDQTGLMLSLPAAAFADMPVSVRIYERGDLLDAFETHVSTEGILKLIERATHLSHLLLLGLLLGLLSVASVGAFFFARQRSVRIKAARAPLTSGQTDWKA